MSFALPDRWVWDFWLADDGDDYHLLYLQAPKSLLDPDLRHHHATIGHAVSTDLVQWEVLGDALGPGPPGAWDDLATWTGSIIRHQGRWHMLYTGASVMDGKLVQRIGIATSLDLTSWRKEDGPAIEVDPRWYETRAEPGWYEEAWRDPWVFAAADGKFHVLITARAPSGPIDGRGVVGHASSPDLSVWEVHPPLSEPGEFGHLEVMQLAAIGDGNVLVFCSQAERVSARRRSRVRGQPDDGVYLVRNVDALGPFDVSRAAPALPSFLYSGRLVQRRGGSLVWLACVDHDGDGRFVGQISDPIPFS